MSQPHLFDEPICPACRSVHWTNTNPASRREDEQVPAENVYCKKCGEFFVLVFINGEPKVQRSPQGCG